MDGSDSSARRGERARVAILLAVFWLCFQTVYFTFLTLKNAGRWPGPSWFADLLRYYVRGPELMICGLGALTCYLIYEAIRRTDGLRLWPKLAVGVGLTAAGSAIFSLGVVQIAGLGAGGTGEAFWRQFVLQNLLWFAPIGLWTAAALSIVYNAEIADRERRMAALREEAHVAQLRALNFQLNPHFLHNTLNSLSALILDRKTEAAEAMVVGLSAFLRETLTRDPLLDISLKREMELQRLYLDIETTRFEDGLKVAFDLPEALAETRVPSLILQPLVENALKYGVPEPGTHMLLRIAARQAGRDLVIEIADNGPAAALQGPGGGIGLRNVRERLALRYGDAARLETASTGEGFLARIVMPMSAP